MIVTLSNAVEYLLARSLLEAESLVDGDYTAFDASRRNRNLKVLRRERPSYFLKQLTRWDAQTVAAQRCEAACYALVGREEAFAPIAPFLPRFHAYDPERHLLVLELLPAGEDLAAYHRRLGAFPAAVGGQLGRLMGTYHRAGAALAERPERSTFPNAAPWALSIPQLGAQAAGLSGGDAQLIAIIRQYPRLERALDALREGWRPDTLIHGDIKWENFMLASDGGGDDIGLKLVDWELADFGDAGWDVGAIFQTYLAYWLTALPIGGDAPAGMLIEQGPFPLEGMHPALAAFWGAYVEARGLPPAEAEAALERAVRYCGARLLQAAYEQCYLASQVGPHALRLLQVGLNILENPRQARTALLGLAAEGD